MEFVHRAKDVTNERMPRLPDVKAKIGYAASIIWKAVDEGTLPPPVALGPRTVAWRESELQAWIDANTFASRANQIIDMKLFIRLLIAPLTEHEHTSCSTLHVASRPTELQRNTAASEKAQIQITLCHPL